MPHFSDLSFTVFLCFLYSAPHQRLYSIVYNLYKYKNNFHILKQNHFICLYLRIFIIFVKTI